MDVLRTYKISPTKRRIIECLFIHRALSAYHLYFLLDPDNIPLTFPFYSWEQTNTPKMHSLYNQVSQLKAQGMLSVAARYDNGGRVFTLTELGLSMAYMILDIPEIEGYHKRGWDNEHGYFPYQLYKPPTERLLKHHTLNIEFLVMMRMLSVKHGFHFDFIDNRYSSVEFSLPEGTTDKSIGRIFRPDGEFIIRLPNSDKKFHCWVEFDMGTEKGALLHDKFEKYNQYLSYISSDLDRQSLSQTIPDAIFFITTASQNIWSRWQNILRNFLNTIDDWGTYLNLLVGNLELLENLVLSHIDLDDSLKRKLNMNLRPLLDDRNFIGQPKPNQARGDQILLPSFCSLYEHESMSLGWEPLFTITKCANQHHLVYLYVSFNTYETIGLSQALHFARQLPLIESLVRIHATEVIPVLTFNEKKPRSLDFHGCDDKEEFQRIFSNYLWHDISQNQWYDQDWIPLSAQVNALTLFANH